MRDKERAEDDGHRGITCQRCGYRGWSDDCGACPNCPPVEKEE